MQSRHSARTGFYCCVRGCNRWSMPGSQYCRKCREDIAALCACFDTERPAPALTARQTWIMSAIALAVVVLCAAGLYR